MRGYRLAQANRMAVGQFRRRCNTNDWYWQWFVKIGKSKDLKREIGRLRKTRKPCSCWMCGHRQLYNGITLQKRRQIQKYCTGLQISIIPKILKAIPAISSSLCSV
jgi:hypothetical protein